MITSEGPYKLIGEKIRAAREMAHMSQKELAEKVGFESATALSLIESGDRKISVDVLQRLADTLHLDLNYFLGKKEEIAGSVKVALRSDKELSTRDKEEILKFIDFIKSNKKKDGGTE